MSRDVVYKVERGLQLFHLPDFRRVHPLIAQSWRDTSHVRPTHSSYGASPPTAKDTTPIPCAVQHDREKRTKERRRGIQTRLFSPRRYVAPPHPPTQPTNPSSLGPRARTAHETTTLHPSLLNTRTTLAGWLVAKRKANASLWFFTLRDSFGTVQLVVNAKDAPSAAGEAERLMGVPLESVVQVQGTVKERVRKANVDESTMKVGSWLWFFSCTDVCLMIGKPVDHVEIHVDSALILNPADKNLPFYPNHPELVRPIPSSPFSCADSIYLERRPMRTSVRSIGIWI